MKRFITNAKKIKLFYDIFLEYNKDPSEKSDQHLGYFVRKLFNNEELHHKWSKYSETLSGDEKEIINVISQGFKIYYCDGYWSYETGNKTINAELERLYPYTAGCLYPETKRVSTQAMNKLREKGLISK